MSATPTSVILPVEHVDSFIGPTTRLVMIYNSVPQRMGLKEVLINAWTENAREIRLTAAWR
jgi:hypothetical protein